MNIVGVYMKDMGLSLVIGELCSSFSGSNKSGYIILKNPVLVNLVDQNRANFYPLLHFVQETEIKLFLDEDIAFNDIFTPNQDLINSYNQVFGSGIVLASAIPDKK